jgi:lipopolysaccharide export system permease protein
LAFSSAGGGVSLVGLNLIDRYVLREWLKIFGLVLGATLGLLLMQALYDDFRDLLDEGATAGDIAFYFVVSTPNSFSVVLPLALLVSLLFSLGQLHRNNEIVAMRAAGVGVGRITRVLWLCAGLLCGLSWFLTSEVIPRSIEQSRTLRDRLKYERDGRLGPADQVGAVKSVAFDNQRESRMWFMNRFSPFTGRGYGVSVTELGPDRRDRTRLLAREAWRDPERGHWVFRAGREIQFDPETGEEVRSVAFEEKVVPRFDEDPALMRVFDRKPTDLSFVELRRILDHFELDDNPKLPLYATRYYALLADTLGPLIILAIAIPFAITGVRVNPAVGVSKSLGLFVLYFLLVKASYALGGKGFVPALPAALLPNAAMLGVGLVLFARIR